MSCQWQEAKARSGVVAVQPNNRHQLRSPFTTIRTNWTAGDLTSLRRTWTCDRGIQGVIYIRVSNLDTTLQVGNVLQYLAQKCAAAVILRQGCCLVLDSDFPPRGGASFWAVDRAAWRRSSETETKWPLSGADLMRPSIGCHLGHRIADPAPSMAKSPNIVLQPPELIARDKEVAHPWAWWRVAPFADGCAQRHNVADAGGPPIQRVTEKIYRLGTLHTLLKGA
ncbi:hypothetical protein FB451DRAFT_1371775 [Mycena latifolia]|nr:hypothetical protein FB451DRAFT_1371775 [Mycena latifolia]